MATVNFSVPEEIKEAFNAEFEGQNKSAIIAALMREAVEHSRRQERARHGIERILARRPHAPVRSSAKLRAARENVRP